MPAHAREFHLNAKRMAYRGGFAQWAATLVLGVMSGKAQVMHVDPGPRGRRDRADSGVHCIG